MLEGGGLGDDEQTQSFTNITLTIVDENDNAPSEKKNKYDF